MHIKKHLSEWDLEQLKYELAKKNGIDKYIGDDWGDISSKQCGKIGNKIKEYLKKEKNL
ncbi:small, acid-soluble spore protein, alpha/beta type [Desulfuribacillus stibiiarsenatis]|uniref:small, acid-soluble spore protein, alpha/beta type n=1 Tax=Desulfuribacillus stibiiarsenatis TaxID=1390249 RepID=UPI0009F710D2|nr:small, acid-soluble spore protein, alpha/beta type [Desulfuribacillus stibiiarsenatis]